MSALTRLGAKYHAHVPVAKAPFPDTNETESHSTKRPPFGLRDLLGRMDVHLHNDLRV